MPSGSFTRYFVKKFPDLSIFEKKIVRPKPSQLCFDAEGMQTPKASDDVYTEILFRKDDCLGGFNVFDVRHRAPIKVKGWWHNNFITELIEDVSFSLYYKKLSTDSLIAVTHVKKDISLAAMRTLEKDPDGAFFFETGEYDFPNIIKSCVNLKGAWFSEMEYSNIRSEAAYGDQIQNDPEFLRLHAVGALSNILVHIEFQGREVRINASKIGSLYFLDEFPEDFCLEFVLFMEQFLKQPEITQK